MVVLIFHPTEELCFIKFQKELISILFNEKRILYSNSPLWIELPELKDLQNQDDLSKIAKSIKSVTFGKIEVNKEDIFVNAKITYNETEILSKLRLVTIFKGEQFSEPDNQKISEKKTPVKQLKIFRLCIAKELSPFAMCITESKWCKLK